MRAQDWDRNIDLTPAVKRVNVLLPFWKHPSVVAPIVLLMVTALVLGLRVVRYHREVRQHRGHLGRLVQDRTSELVALNEEIRTDRQRLAVTLRGIGDAVIATDRNGEVVLVNAVAERLFDCTEADIRHRKLHEFAPAGRLAIPIAY